ncbi:MAG: hypothetical protein ABSG04_15275 [Verrucomicrobiota bacterium]
MKSNSILFTTLTLAAPLAFLLQGSDLAQAKGGGGSTPLAQDAEAATPAPAPSPRANVDFFFPGGTPSEFVAAVEKQYRVEWAKVVDIAENMREVHIPALRMSQQSVESMFPVYRGGGGRGGGGAGGGGGFGGGGIRGGFGSNPEERDPLMALITLYNRLGQAKSELGSLMVEGDLAKPSIVMFRSIYANSAPELTLKAFALNGIPVAEWDKLAQEINDQIGMIHGMNHKDAVRYKVDVHRDSKLLVVFGTASDLDAVESLVAAWRTNYGPGMPPARPVLPSTGLPGPK